MPNTCLVPSCKTRTSKGKKIIKKQVKQKRRFFLPTQIERRNSWIAAIGIENVPKGKSYWCCEDHFNLPKDTKNWGEYNFFAGVTLRLKDDVVPHKKLQPLRKHQKLVSPTKQQKRESPPKYLPSTSVVLHQTGNSVEFSGFLCKMGRNCFVPGCKSGYDGSRCSLFRPPNNKLEEWARKIHRADRQLTRNDNVCEKHFDPIFIIRTAITETYSYPLKCPRLDPEAVPTIFPNCPAHKSKTVAVRHKSLAKGAIKSNQSRKRHSECSECNDNNSCADTIEGAAPSKLLAIPHDPLKNEEIEEGSNLIEPKVEFINIKKEFPEKDTQNYLNGFMTLDLDDAYNRITSHSNLDKTWLKVRANNHICFFKIEEEPLPNIKFCVFLSGDLSLSVTRNNENIFEVTCRDQTKLNFPLGITNLVHLEQILEEIDWFLNVPKDETFEDILDKVSDIISPICDKFPEKKVSIMLLKQQIGLLKSSKGRSTSDFDGAKGHRKSSRKSRRKIS